MPTYTYTQSSLFDFSALSSCRATSVGNVSLVNGRRREKHRPGSNTEHRKGVPQKEEKLTYITHSITAPREKKGEKRKQRETAKVTISTATNMLSHPKAELFVSIHSFV